MKIGIPIAAYESGTTGEYVARALRKLGHEVDILSQWTFYDSFRVGAHDFYFCVDSGGPLNLFESSIENVSMQNLSFWMIDFRRGKRLKDPNDFRTCKLISERGGTIYQAQYEDDFECTQAKMASKWLPLAADPDVWSDEPREQKIFDVGFVGNVWDAARAEALESITRSGLKCSFRGHGASYMESGAERLRMSRIGFNISSHFYENPPVRFDVNMRVFETLSCGIPLVTNDVPSLKLLFGDPLPRFIRTYRDVQEIPSVLKSALSDGTFVGSGDEARQWIMNGNTYFDRMRKVCEWQNLMT